MIELVNCTKSYHSGKKNQVDVLKNITITIPDHCFIAICGKSGSGKTTLIHIMAGLLSPTSGQVIHDGVDISRFSERKLARFRSDHVGVIFQNFAPLLNETAEENIRLPLLFCTKQQNDLPDIEEIMEERGLSQLRKKKVRELSGGQMQRVAVARALVTNPDVIFADETTGSLDSASSVEILELLKEWHNRGKSILLVTHDLDIAQQCASILWIKDGKIQ